MVFVLVADYMVVKACLPYGITDLFSDVFFALFDYTRYCRDAQCASAIINSNNHMYMIRHYGIAINKNTVIYYKYVFDSSFYNDSCF